MTYNFNLNELGIQKITQTFEKISIKTLFILLKKAQGRGSEDIKKECNVNCFDFFFFPVFLMDVMGGKNHNQLKITALK